MFRHWSTTTARDVPHCCGTSSAVIPLWAGEWFYDCPSVCPSVCLSICLWYRCESMSVCVQFVYVLHVRLSVCLHICLTVCLWILYVCACVLHMCECCMCDCGLLQHAVSILLLTIRPLHQLPSRLNLLGEHRDSPTSIPQLHQGVHWEQKSQLCSLIIRWRAVNSHGKKELLVGDMNWKKYCQIGGEKESVIFCCVSFCMMIYDYTQFSSILF